MRYHEVVAKGIALTNWLREVLPSKNELDEVLICGGTADYLRLELDDVFPTTPVVWHGGVEIPPNLNEQWLGSRLADVWALSVYHGIKVRAVRREGERGREGEGGSLLTFPHSPTPPFPHSPHPHSQNEEVSNG